MACNVALWRVTISSGRRESKSVTGTSERRSLALSALERIAERRIKDAIERGDFAQLQGQGRPVLLGGDDLVAPELRMAYRILANAGWIPEEVCIRKELGEVRALLASGPPGKVRENAAQRLNHLLAKLEACRRQVAKR